MDELMWNTTQERVGGCKITREGDSATGSSGGMMRGENVPPRAGCAFYFRRD